jgi:hypothetical protein
VAEHVLWVSRHRPLPAQVDFLRKRLGEVKISELIGYVPTAEYVIEKAEDFGCDYILAVLPLSVIAKICELAEKREITVLYAEMKEIYSGEEREAYRLLSEAPDKRTVVQHSDAWRVFEFVSIRRIKGVRLELEDF